MPEGKRFRDVTLPAGMEKWYMPGFDAGKWKTGRSPIGVGVFKAHGNGKMWTATPDRSFKNNADWGDGEFLMMRTTFNVSHGGVRKREITGCQYRNVALFLKGLTKLLDGPAGLFDLTAGDQKIHRQGQEFHRETFR